MADTVEILLQLRNVRQFVSGADKASGSVEGIGKSAEKSGAKAKVGWKGLAKWAAPAAAFAGVTTFLKGSVGATEDLAKNTMALQRATGLDAKTASEWATVTKARGINTKQMQVGLTKLSKTMESARGGNKKALDVLNKYGVSQDQIAKGDIPETMNRLADSFALMKNPAEKAALAQQLFGKSGQALVPMLSGGSAGLQEQLQMADKYGATIGDTEGPKEMIAKQREMKIAMEGLKVTVGSALLPSLEALVGMMLRLVQVFSPLLRNSTALQVVLGTLTVLFLVYRTAVMVSTIMTLGFNAALLLIPLAIVAIVAGVVILYKKWGWFHNAVNNTFAWIKANWPLLLAILTGPFGIAVALIVKHFDKIKSAAKSVVGVVKSVVGGIVGAVKGAFGGAGDFVAGIARGIADWINAHTPFGDRISAGPIHFTLPALAGGGFIRAGGAALVGEQGPELVTLPTGSTVYPTPAVDAAAAAAGGGGTQTIVTQVFLDRRQIAEAVGGYVADRKARR